MPEKLCIQIRAPKGSFRGEVEYGYYVVEGGKVTLTDGNGTSLSDGGRQYSHQLRDGENPRIRAVLLSRLRHRNASPRGFNGPIHYPTLKNA